MTSLAECVIVLLLETLSPMSSQSQSIFDWKSMVEYGGANVSSHLPELI